MKAKNLFYTSLLLTTSCLLPTADGFAQFCYAKNIPTDSVNFSIVNADFNKDGFEDLATVAMDSLVSVLLGDGKGNFASPANFNIGSGAMGMSVISQDFNKDGKLDLATADMMNMNVAVLLGNGDGTFGAPTTFSVAPTPYMLVSADFNKDGNFDIATANNYSSNNVSILLGHGNGTFGNAINYSVSSSLGTSSIATADFNKDGNPDLVVGNSDTNYVSVMLGHGDGSFASASNLVVGIYLSSWPQSVICVDLNADNNVDIVSANGGDNTVSVLLGHGNGIFANDTSFAVSPSGHQNNHSQSVAAADFNKDGKMDLATANLGSYDVSILLSDGAGGFRDVANFAVGVYPYMLTCADFNKDTAIDIAVANANSNEISILLNCSPLLGIPNLTQVESVNSYPNPSNGKFNIQIESPNPKGSDVQINIYNVMGERVYEAPTLKAVNNNTLQGGGQIIDISNQPNGIYFLQLKSETGTGVKKIMIQK
jgi:hypothetical protein